MSEIAQMVKGYDEKIKRLKEEAESFLLETIDIILVKNLSEKKILKEIKDQIERNLNHYSYTIKWEDIFEELNWKVYFIPILNAFPKRKYLKMHQYLQHEERYARKKDDRELQTLLMKSSEYKKLLDFCNKNSISLRVLSPEYGYYNTIWLDW